MKYLVTVEVEARNARDAKRMVEGRENPSGAEQFQRIAELQQQIREANESDDDERALALLAELKRVKAGDKKVRAPKASDKLRDMDYPRAMGYILDRKTLTPVKRPYTQDEQDAIERDRIRRYGV